MSRKLPTLAELQERRDRIYAEHQRDTAIMIETYEQTWIEQFATILTAASEEFATERRNMEKIRNIKFDDVMPALTNEAAVHMVRKLSESGFQAESIPFHKMICIYLTFDPRKLDEPAAAR